MERPGLYAWPTQAPCPRARATELIHVGKATVCADALGQAAPPSTALYVNGRTARSGYFDRSLAVYGREGQPCPRCGTADPPRGVHDPFRLSLPALPAYPGCREARFYDRTSRSRSLRIAGSEGLGSSIVKRLDHFLFVRHAHNWRLLFRFGLVGGLRGRAEPAGAHHCNKVGRNEHDIFLGLP